MLVKASLFTHNFASLGGGLFAWSPSSITVKSSTFMYNAAVESGGAIYAELWVNRSSPSYLQGTLSFKATNFTENYGAGVGDDIMAGPKFTLQLQACNINTTSPTVDHRRLRCEPGSSVSHGMQATANSGLPTCTH